MKKLTVFMIFVLMFSITILAEDLSKEEIINELKKITIVANKDIRLEMYDILSGKLGLKVTDDSIIKAYSGSGTKNTRPFVIQTDWEIQWHTKDGIQISLYDRDGNFVEAIASQMESGKGSSYNPKKGTFYLNIFSMGDWEIKIVEVK